MQIGTAPPRRGEIYWAPAATKIRPVVIVSNDVGNRYSNHVIVVPTTRTVPEKQYPFQVHLEAGDPLPSEGVVDCGSIYTLRKDDLHEYITSLSAEQMIRVDQALRVSLSLR